MKVSDSAGEDGVFLLLTPVINIGQAAFNLFQFPQPLNPLSNPGLLPMSYLSFYVEQLFCL